MSQNQNDFTDSFEYQGTTIARHSREWDTPFANKDGYQVRLVSQKGIPNYDGTLPVFPEITKQDGHRLASIPLTKAEDIKRFTDLFITGLQIDGSMPADKIDEYVQATAYSTFSTVVAGRESLTQHQKDYLVQRNPNRPKQTAELPKPRYVPGK